MNDRTFPGARRWLPLICMSLLVGAAAPGWAQLRRPAEGASVAPRIPGDRSLSTELQISGAPRTTDYIVAVVNQEPITHTEVDKRVQRVIESAPANARLPAADAAGILIGPPDARCSSAISSLRWRWLRALRARSAL